MVLIYIVCDAKIRIIFYIASDLSETLSLFNLYEKGIN